MLRYPVYGPTARASYDIVLTGAGISMSAPSSIPNGDALMCRAWERLIEGLSADQVTTLEPLTTQLHQERPPIWLEPLAQIVFDYTGDFGVVASTYSEVSTQRFNENHLALARLHARQVTVNMDTLLEAAGTDAWHLHGRWDQPDSIVSTVQQYSDGLPQQVQHDLLSLLDGARVLVIGYSGRDVDVIPVLARSKPRLLHWMHYGRYDLSPQAQQLRGDLNGVMDVFAGNAADVLNTLPTTRIPAPQTISGSPAPDAFKTIPGPLRLLCTAAIALEVGWGSLTLALLADAGFTGRVEISRRKLLARARSRTGNYSAALLTLTRPPSDIRTLVAWPSTTNEIAALLPAAGHPQIATVMNCGLLLTRSRTSARIRLARSHLKFGRLGTAHRSLSAVCANDKLHRLIGEHGRVDALDLLADTQKTLGDYEGAAASASKAVSLVHYANASQRGSALRRLAEIAHVAGVDEVRRSAESALQSPASILEEVNAEASFNSDRALMFWSATTRADVANFESVESVFHWLDLADEAMPKREGAAETYFELVRIEAMKRWGSVTDAVTGARRLVAVLASRRTAGSVERLVAQSVLAECEAVDGELEAARRRLDRVVRNASKMQMKALAGRAKLLRNLIRGVDVNLLAAEFRDAGWHREANLAGCSNADLGRIAWPVLL